MQQQRENFGETFFNSIMPSNDTMVQVCDATTDT